MTFDDDAAVLGEFVLESDNAVANVADNDSVGIVFKAYDSATAKTEYASIDLRADDVTDGTEDGGILLKTFVNGTERTVATLGAANTVGAAQATLALTSSDWAIGATGDMTGIGSLAMGGALSGATEAAVDGKYAVTGGDATTGLMVQKAAVTALAQATQTNTFAVAFGAAPIVVCTYTEDPGDVRPIFVTSVTTTNFISNQTSDKNFGYIAVGTRP